VFEVHPEVCFATMACAPLATGKKTWAGLERRRELLRSAAQPLPNPPETGRDGRPLAIWA